jgi:hypothetical protein
MGLSDERGSRRADWLLFWLLRFRTDADVLGHFIATTHWSNGIFPALWLVAGACPFPLTNEPEKYVLRVGCY